MNFDTYSIVYLISNFFSIFIIRRFAEAFFKKQSNYKIVSVLLYLIYFIITSLAYLKLDIPIIALCINWISIFVVFFTYESTIQKRIVYTTYIIAFMLFPELVIGAITGYFKFSFFSEGNYSSEIGIISTKIITYIEALLFRNYRIRKDSQSVSTSLWISTIIIPLSTLIYECMFVSNDNLTKDKVIASVAMLFIINVTAFHLYDSLTKSYVQQSKLSILETENALYSKQCEIMQSSTEELQGFRHDMNNQFIALSQLIKSEQYGDAERQLSHLTLLTKSKIIYSTSGNVIIDGLINYKLQNALNDRIKVKTEIAVPNRINIETTDLVAILGNLIDNALNALADVPEDRRSLTIKVVFSQGRLIVRTSNPYTGDILCKDGKIVSDKQNSKQHGYGLNNIAKSVNKYKGYMNIDYSSNTFTVDIIMYI
ncbi:MAG: GHKL domain-containing protein [Ruminococcus sp.]|nr:GHKL domain-containing protein [Ruminococcus sp.]